jgi:NAD(P) transhydrogenase subunit alpha
MPTLFVPTEITSGETRVAAVPETVKKYVKAGLKVRIQEGAGAGSHIPDPHYQEAGAELAADAGASFGQADVILKLHPPTEKEVERMREGSLLISFLFPFNNAAVVQRLAQRKVSAFAMDQIPRITRAQSMDALSSQANIAGYKAVLLAASALPRYFPLLMTAAGTIPPARVVVLGAGVAGLQAIATARRLGAVVEVSDIRPAVKEQVQSLGGRFIDVPTDEKMETAGGYAKEASEEFLKKQRQLVDGHIAQADVVICTALVPGRPAPRLVSAEVVSRMRPGSVIVDLAVEQGGNCELSEPGKTVVKKGVTLIGLLNVPGTVAFHASEVYAKNIQNVVTHLLKEGQFRLDFQDEITTGSVVTHGGEIRNEKLAEALKTVSTSAR